MADSEDKKQLKFIEILMVVGGIIGGLGFKSEDFSIRFLLTVFLISSLMYYYEISNKLHLKYQLINLFAMLTSSMFSGLITYPLRSSPPDLISFWGSSYPSFIKDINSIMAISLFYIIFINLQEKSGQVKSKIFNSQNLFIIIGTIITVMILNYLTASS